MTQLAVLCEGVFHRECGAYVPLAKQTDSTRRFDGASALLPPDQRCRRRASVFHCNRLLRLVLKGPRRSGNVDLARFRAPATVSKIAHGFAFLPLLASIVRCERVPDG